MEFDEQVVEGRETLLIKYRFVGLGYERFFKE